MKIRDVIKEELLDKSASSYFSNIEKEIGSINAAITQNPVLNSALSKPVSGINTSLQTLKAYLQAQAQEKVRQEEEKRKQEALNAKMKTETEKKMYAGAGVNKSIENKKGAIQNNNNTQQQ